MDPGTRCWGVLVRARDPIKMYDQKWSQSGFTIQRLAHFQVKQKNHVANIDILEESIKKQGLLQPIGLAKSKITEESDDYEWEVLWGQSRLLVFMRLGHKTIPAMVLDKVLTKEEGMAIALAQSKTKVDMSKKDMFCIKKILLL